MSDIRIRPYFFNVENFRNFKNVSFELGRKITVISGQNGVGKSNLLSLIASGSGLNKKSVLGSNFQPEFYEFFNIDENEDFENYKLFLTYIEENGNQALIKRLSFKDDTKTGRGIRIIPRTTNVNTKGSKINEAEEKVTVRYTVDGIRVITRPRKVNANGSKIKEAEENAKVKYGVGGAARVRIPTIYLSLSRLYPLGERKDSVKVTKINEKNLFYQKKANKKYKEWYNMVIPNSISNDAVLSKIKKNACSRASLHMDINNTPALSQSIGQDNLGNIISALVDIYMLSSESDYRSALLCIDEFDVSLHPDSQIRLLELFDLLSHELHIQFVLSSHSLTILEEMLRREKKNKLDFKVVYLKSPSLPSVIEIKNYELLKADMFDSPSYQRPKVKIYFEDKIGNELFGMLLNSYRNIYSKVEYNNKDMVLRNGSNVRDYEKINNRILALKSLLKLNENVKQVTTQLGCEELLKIADADSYFKRVIFILDGDARYKDPGQKPKIREHLKEKYDQKKFNYNDRTHVKNICFFPDYFAPESFLYAIIHTVSTNSSKHHSFWRGLDLSEETTLYTPEKIIKLFSHLSEEYNNDDLKAIFKDSVDSSEVWQFIKKSDIVTYYYSDYKTVDELLSFLESVKEAYDMTLPITLSNRHS